MRPLLSTYRGESVRQFSAFEIGMLMDLGWQIEADEIPDGASGAEGSGDGEPTGGGDGEGSDSEGDGEGSESEDEGNDGEGAGEGSDGRGMYNYGEGEGSSSEGEGLGIGCASFAPGGDFEDLWTDLLVLMLAMFVVGSVSRRRAL